VSKYEPTEAEVEALALRLAKYHCASAEAALSQEYDDARWLLKHYEPRSDEQRCSGRGRLKLGNDHFALCPGCTRCEPRETPKSDTNALLHPDSKCSCEAEGWCEYCRTHCIHCGAREEMHSACREFVPPPPAAPAAESAPMRTAASLIHDEIAAESEPQCMCVPHESQCAFHAGYHNSTDGRAVVAPRLNPTREDFEAVDPVSETNLLLSKLGIVAVQIRDIVAELREGK